MADWTGRKIENVLIGDLIARGGMAEIYLGQHETHGQVAVKVLRGVLEHDQIQLARFQREAEVIGELKHPNIVQLKDYIVHDETPCLVMEYIQGPSLAAYMKALHDRKQRIPIALVAQILRPVASALDYAHSLGIIHRDIKPANVLLRSSTLITLESELPLDVEPVLTDFGLVRLVDSTMHTTTGSVSGTPAYMSPEQARGEKADHRTDIYSLGIMLYEMLAGAVPFISDTTFGMLMKHINETPPPIRGLSLEMYALLERALAKDPDLRYQSAGELAGEFMALFNGQTISPGTLQMAELARKFVENGGKKSDPQPTARSRWGRLTFEITLGLALLGAIVYGFIRTPNAADATPVAINPDIPAGRLRFDDFSQVAPMDQLTLSLNNVVVPEAGTHYEGWLVSNDGTSIRKIGSVALNDAGVGSVILVDSSQQSFFQNYDKAIITLETDGAQVNQPTGAVVYSSVFPQESITPMRKLLVTHEGGLENISLIWGLWYYSGSWIATSINGDAGEKITGLREAWENGDESTVRARTEEVINQIVGSQSDQFLDYDHNGTVDNTPGELTTDGFGSFPNGTQAGYINAVIQQAKLAAEASDSTPSIRDNSEKLQICVQNMQGRLDIILQEAHDLMDTPFGSRMEPIITDLETLASTLMDGNDTDSNGLIEPIAGECGASDAYTFAYLMADMLLYPGENRTPPSGK